jgi:hypothetical protein
LIYVVAAITALTLGWNFNRKLSSELLVVAKLHADNHLLDQQRMLAIEDLAYLKKLFKDKPLFAYLNDEQFVSLCRIVKGAIEVEKVGGSIQ